MSAVKTNWSLVRASARRAARLVTREHGGEWLEDIVQVVMTRAWLQHQAGFGVTRERYRQFAHGALRSIYGDSLADPHGHAKGGRVLGLGR